MARMLRRQLTTDRGSSGQPGQVTCRKQRNTGLVEYLDKLVCNELSTLDFKQAFALQHVCQSVSPLQQCSGSQQVLWFLHGMSMGLNQVGHTQGDKDHEKRPLEGGASKAASQHLTELEPAKCSDQCPANCNGKVGRPRLERG